MNILLRYSFLILYSTVLIACGGGNNGGSGGHNPIVPVTPSYDLHVDQVSPVPIVNDNSQIFYVYVTNEGTAPANGITWSLGAKMLGLKVSSRFTLATTISYLKSLFKHDNLQSSSSSVTIVDQSECANIAVGQTCRLELSTNNAAVTMLTASVGGALANLAGGGGLIQSYFYVPSNPDPSFTLGLSPIFSLNYANAPAADFYIINNDMVNKVVLTKNLPGLPSNVSADFSTCPDDLLPGNVCQVRLSFNKGSSGPMNIPIKLAGSIDGNLLPEQKADVVFSVTDALLGNIITIPNETLIANDSNGNPSSVSGVGVIYNSGRAALNIASVTSTHPEFVTIANDSCSHSVLPANRFCTYTPLLNVNSVAASGSANVQVKYNDHVSDSIATTMINWSYLPPDPNSQIIITLNPNASNCSYGFGSSFSPCYANPNEIGGSASSIKVNFTFTIIKAPADINLTKIDLGLNELHKLNSLGYTRETSSCDSIPSPAQNTECSIVYAVPEKVYNTTANLDISDPAFTYYAFGAVGNVLSKNSNPLDIPVRVVLPTLAIESIGAASLGGKKPVTLIWQNLFINNVTTTTGITASNGQSVTGISATAPFCSTASAGTMTCRSYIQSIVESGLLNVDYSFDAIGEESVTTTPLQIANVHDNFSLAQPVIFMTSESYPANLSHYDNHLPQTGEGGADNICNQEAHQSGSLLNPKLSFKALLIDKDREPCGVFVDKDNNNYETMACGGSQASADWPLNESEVFFNPNGTLFNIVNQYYSFDGRNANFEFVNGLPVDPNTNFWFGAPSIFLGDVAVNPMCPGGASCPNDIVAWSDDFLTAGAVIAGGVVNQEISYGTAYNSTASNCSNYTSTTTAGAGVVKGSVGTLATFEAGSSSPTTDKWYQSVINGFNWGGNYNIDDSGSDSPFIKNVWSNYTTLNGTDCRDFNRLVCVSQ